jgi:hypothetical protein
VRIIHLRFEKRCCLSFRQLRCVAGLDKSRSVAAAIHCHILQMVKRCLRVALD